MYLGRYRLEERQAPQGCVINTTPEYAELTYAGETVEITQTALGLYDERQKVDVTLFKLWKQMTALALALARNTRIFLLACMPPLT